MVELLILGPLEVLDDAGTAVPLGPPKQQALFALLAIHPNEVLSTERIIDELWGADPPGDGARNVRVYVSRLRKALEPGRPPGSPGQLIVTAPPGYVLRIEPEAIDAHRFEHLIGEARRDMAEDPASARRAIDEALELWRDRPLAGLAFEELAQTEIRRLAELHLSALELRHEASIRTGDPGSAIPELEKLVAEHPLRERLVALLMEAMAGSGRQAEALRAYRALELLLAQEMGLEPSEELRRLEQRILLQHDEAPAGPLPLTPRRRPDRALPVRVTSFVGRDHDLDRVDALLSENRLLTLTGPGGVGKTSLAIEAARRAATRYADRVWLVDLSSIPDASGVTAALADAVGAREESDRSGQEMIAAAVRGPASLILLDNCEHLVNAVSTLVVSVLSAVPELTILCTSRRSLSVAGESLFEVGPLALPPVGADLDEVRAAASSQLFAERAVAAAPHFGIIDDSAHDIAALCRQLDGIPLALELAASNLRAMTLSEIINSLDDRLSLGGRRRGLPHHQSLRATMQWSYDLLEEQEQTLFDRLSVFAGRFSRAAVLAIGNGAVDSSSAALAALVDASMVVADVSGRAAEYQILPTLRDFGISNLRMGGELAHVRRLHAEYLVADAEEMALPLVPIGSTKRISRNVSVEDFRAAADWALRAGHGELATALLVPLSQYWVSGGGGLAEASDWISRIYLKTPVESLDQWRLHMAAAVLDWFAGRDDKAEAAFRSLSATAAHMGEAVAASEALHQAGRIRWRRGDLPGAREDLSAAVEAAPGWTGRSHSAREGLAVLSALMGDVSAGAHHADVLGELAQQTGDPVAMCSALNALAWVKYYEEDLEEAVRLFEECRDLAIEEGDWPSNLNARFGLAWLCPAADRPEQALQQAMAGRDLAIESGNTTWHAEAMILMGYAQLKLGDLEGAAGSLAQGLGLLRDQFHRVDHMTRGLRFAGWVALAEGRSDLAVRFLTASEAEHRRIGFVDPPVQAERVEHSIAAMRRELGDAEYKLLRDAATASAFDTQLVDAIDYLNELSEAGR